MGQPKGFLQLLWELGFVDRSKDVFNYYILRERKDNCGNTFIETFLSEMMRNCLDFIEEETLLQINAHNIGDIIYRIIANCNPKCHPDIISGGIG